jgi:DNA-binding PadR family transcriptional regulator
MSRDILGAFEFQVMSAIQARPGDAYGAALMEFLEERTDKRISPGALYTTLDRLAKKGFLSSAWGEPTAERGGRRKRIYRIVAPGALAMRRTVAAYQAPAIQGPLPQGA